MTKPKAIQKACAVNVAGKRGRLLFLPREICLVTVARTSPTLLATAGLNGQKSAEAIVPLTVVETQLSLPQGSTGRAER
jgi:hypothetical protein